MRSMALLAVITFLAASHLACCGDVAGCRQVLITQTATVQSPEDRFNIDTSRIPASWFEEISTQNQCCGPLIRLRIRQEHRIKIILAPDEPVQATTVRATTRMILVPATQPIGADRLKLKSDEELVQGDWQEVSRAGTGKAEGPEFSKHFAWTFAGNKLHFRGDFATPSADIEMRLALRPETKPKEIDLTVTRTPDGKNLGDRCLGIYELDGNDLKLCYSKNSRPRELGTRKNDPDTLFKDSSEKMRLPQNNNRSHRPESSFAATLAYHRWAIAVGLIGSCFGPKDGSRNEPVHT